MPPKRPRSSRANIAKIAQTIYGLISYQDDEQVGATSQRVDSTSQHAELLMSLPFTRQTPATREMESVWLVQVLFKLEKMKAKQLWNLEEGKRVKCPVNEYGQGTKRARGMIGVWLGDLATDTDLIPLNFFYWRLVPEKYVNDAMTLIQSKIVFETSEGLEWAWKILGEGKRWC